MAVKIARVKYEVDTTGLETAKRVLADIAKETGLSEEQVKEMSKALHTELGLIEKLEVQEKHLLEARKKSNDPNAIKSINAELKKTEAEMHKLTGATDKAAKSFGGIKDFVVGGLLVSGIQRVTQAIGGWIKGGIASAAAFQKVQLQLEGVVGGAKNAERIVNQLESFDGSGLFAFEDLAKASKTLGSFGVAADEIIPRIQKLGDLSLGTGVSVEQLADAYVKLQAKGEAGIKQLITLNQQGIPIFAQLGKDLGLTIAEVGDLAEKGKISAEQVQKAFNEMTAKGGQFFNMTAKQAETAGGQIEIFKDNIDDAGRNLATAFLPALNSIVGAFNSLFEVEVKESDLLADEQAELNALTNAITHTNEGSAVRKQLLEEMQSKYPDFLKNLNIETVTNKELSERLGEVNEEYKKKILITAQQEALAEKTKELTKNVKDQAFALKVFGGIVADVNKQYGNQIDTTASLENQISQVNKVLVAEHSNNLDRINTLNTLNGALTSYTALQGSYENILVEVNEQQGVFNDLMQRMGFELNENNKAVHALATVNYPEWAQALVEANKQTKVSAEDAKKLASEYKTLQDAIQKLREEAELFNAGGADSVAGLKILKDRAKAELEADKAFQQLSSTEQGLLRQKIDDEFAKKIWEAEKHTAKKAQTGMLKDFGDHLEKKLKLEEDKFKKSLVDLSIIDKQWQLDNFNAKKDIKQAHDVEMLQKEIELREEHGENVLDLKLELAEKEKAIDDDVKASYINNQKEKEAALEQGFQVASTLINILGDQAQAQANKELNALTLNYKRDLAQAGDNAEKKAEIEKRFTEQSAAINKELAEQKRRLAVFQIIVDTARAIAQALPNPVLAAIAAAAGLAQLSVAESAQYKKGGYTGDGNVDDEAGIVHKKEFVMPADKTEKYRPILDLMYKDKLDLTPMFQRSMSHSGINNYTSDFSDKRMVDKMAEQNRNTKKLINKIDYQNNLLSQSYGKRKRPESYYSTKYKF